MAKGKVDTYIQKVAEGVKGSEGVPSIGPTYGSIHAKDVPAQPENLKTCWELFSSSSKENANKQALGYRKIVDGKAGEYEFYTYQQVFDTVLTIGSAMRFVGLEPKGRCGIYGSNSPEWFQAMEACYGSSVYCVPLYDTLGEDAVEFILGHAEVTIVFVQDVKLPLLLKSLSKNTHDVKTLVSLSTLTNEQKATIKETSSEITAFSWEEFKDLGKKNPLDMTPPKKEDICTIMYTSGTTGEPKGVQISHASVTDIVWATKYYVGNSLGLPDDVLEVYLSFLPMAHIFDLVAEILVNFVGGKIGYWQGNAAFLMDDLKALQPTLFIGVPRIYDRIHAGFHKKISESGFLSKTIFNFGYNRKLNRMKSGFTHDKAAPLMDKLIFNKVKQSMGGRVRVVLSGAAPLADHVEEFCRVALCCPVVQGYGLTESCSGSFLGVPDVWSMKGTVGPPMPNLVARLESVPEMNYDAFGTPETGEVCVKSPSVFSGYYKKEDLTKEALIDGWLHTGDIGEWQPDGSLKIIDRKKNIFKLSQGEYVAVEKLENIYSLASIVDSIWVYGSSFESSLVAVVIPTKAELESWAKSQGIEGNFQAICQNPKAKEYVLKELTATQKSNKLKGFEAIKAVHLETEPFDIEKDLVTPTFKKKRPQLKKHYQTILDDMYKTLNPKK